MKGTIALVLFAAAATWAFLFFPLDKKASRPSAAKREDAQAATPAADEPIARVPTPSSPQGSTTSGAAQPAAGKQATRAASASISTPSGRGDVRIIGTEVANTAGGPRATAPAGAAQPAPNAPFDPDKAEATGELGEGVLSPDYRMSEESYIQEPRDGPWALENERKIRSALMASELAERVVIVHCQSTQCRIQLEPQGQDPFAELLRVPGLVAVTGLDSSTPYSLNGTELIVYARPENAPAQPK